MYNTNIDKTEKAEILLTMDWLRYKLNFITSSRTLIIFLVLIFILPVSFCVYTIIHEYQAINTISIEIIDIELENGSADNRIYVTFRISNPTNYNTPKFIMDVFIRPISFSSDRFISETKLSETVVAADSSTIQTLPFNVDHEVVEVTMKGITMKTTLHSKLLFNSIQFSKTGMYYYQS